METNGNGTTRKPTTKKADDIPAPPFVAARDNTFDRLKAERTAWLAEQPRERIDITYIPSNGGPQRTLAATSWQSTPWSMAQAVSVRSQLDKWLVARVDGVPYHLERPLEKACTLELLSFDDAGGKEAFWRSSAHILGNAAERRFGCNVNSAEIGAEGFHHEWSMVDETTGATKSISKVDYKPLLQNAHKVINKGLKFEGLVVKKAGLQELFSYNKYKLHAIEKLRDDQSLEVYRCGQFIDISPTPMLMSTALVKAFELTSNSSSYFLGDANNDSLQRMYGVSFPDKKSLDEHKEWMAQASLRDHRKIGKDQELFFFHSTISPGSAFFLPAGQRIYNTMMAYMREEYWKRGYSEVTTPNMFNSSLWKQSGHWEHYQDDMFRFEVEKDDWALKPMNCPGHCVLFDHRERTYRELPLRVAEFGVLHRNELSGALTGLTRVRRFVQDDTHIFCMPSQVEQEVKNVLEWLTDFYHRMFGFTFKVKLSTMPEKHLGDVETWQRAEEQLIKALDGLKQDTGVAWELNPGDGAFYGPKIDIAICDALKRDHQCASIQLDFQLPQQFNLEYRTDEQTAPVQKTVKPSKHVKAKKAIENGVKPDVAAIPNEHATDESTAVNGHVVEELPTTNGHALETNSIPAEKPVIMDAFVPVEEPATTNGHALETNGVPAEEHSATNGLTNGHVVETNATVAPEHSTRNEHAVETNGNPAQEHSTTNGNVVDVNGTSTQELSTTNGHVETNGVPAAEQKPVNLDSTGISEPLINGESLVHEQHISNGIESTPHVNGESAAHEPAVTNGVTIDSTTEQAAADGEASAPNGGVLHTPLSLTQEVSTKATPPKYTEANLATQGVANSEQPNGVAFEHHATTENGSLTNGTAINGANVNGTETNSTSVSETFVNGTSTDGTHVNGTETNGVHVNGTEKKDETSAPAEPINQEHNHTHDHAHDHSHKKASDNIPARKELTPGFARPVMIHRGILGSFERFIAILCEHLYGKWPFWLSPRQILVIPVTGVVHEYAIEVQKKFSSLHMHTDVDLSNNTLSKKIRAGQTKRYNFIFVVGRKERDTESVNVRNRDDPATHKRGAPVPLEEAMGKLNKLKLDRELDGRIEFKTTDA